MNGTITIMQPDWTRRAVLKAAGSIALAASAASLALPRPRSAEGATTHRPISDFHATQGTTTGFFPPGGGADYSSWFSSLSAPPVLLAGVDYAGLENIFLGGALGTSSSGTVIERSLADGRAEVSVTLNTNNALSWATEFTDTGAGSLLFGHFAQDVAAGADAAIGNSHLKWSFINTAPGAPLPDLFVALLGQFFGIGSPPEGFEPISVSFRATAGGTLREAFGVPDGTPGRLKVVQICTIDACSEEIVDLRAVGQ